MRRWRVGTFSMGMLLIIIGIVLLTSLVSGFPLAELLFQWWPVLLIILGVEILAYIYLAKEDHPKIKYDVFSMFMIIVICFVSLGAYTVSTIGVLPRLKAMVTSQDHNFTLADKSIDVSSDIDKIVLELSNASFSILGHNDANLKVYGNGGIYTDSQESVEKLINSDNIVTRRVDNTLVLQFNELPRLTEFNQGVKNLKYTVVLPPKVEVEIKRSSYAWQRLEINSDALNRNMFVDNSGALVVNAGADASLMVEASMKENYQFSGNVDWVYEEDQKNNSRATLKIGEGKYKLYLFNRGEIEFKHLK